MVSIYVGNTDNNWFDFLRAQTSLDEVNFWQPSAKNFKAITEGELFAFRLKSPRNKIGGFGVLTNSSVLSVQMAWTAFGPSNGSNSLAEMISLIDRYRPGVQVSANTFIGCRILVQPVLFPQHLWFDVPESWSQNIVTGKIYSTDEPEGLRLWDQLLQRAHMLNAETNPGLSEDPHRYGMPTLIRPRLGQGAFRVAVLEAYGRQCAFTRGKVLPALDAAHIRPFADGGSHEKTNGIFLRKDMHSVFDAGYITIDSTYRIVVSDKIRDVFNNGEEYRRLHGSPINLPRNPDDNPNLQALNWHNNEKFVG